MKVEFIEFVNEIDELIKFITSDTWEFYGTPNPKPERLRRSFENGYYTGEGCRTFWIVADENNKIGTIRIYDLDDGAPLFDIMIHSKFKRQGIGTVAVNWLENFIFTNYPDIDRIEANTRVDNYAMRCVFHKCNFVKEAHHRKAWVGNDGIAYDAIVYGIIKEDWENKKITEVQWNDFKC